jgi:1-aminocyclopropane-1-carboxylate deaminase
VAEAQVQPGRGRGTESEDPADLWGAYSNHLRATAAAGCYYGFRTIGVVRGEEHLPLNPILAYAVEHGMHLAYLDRVRYRNKTSESVIDRLRERFGDFYLLPEGGATPWLFEAAPNCRRRSRPVSTSSAVPWGQVGLGRHRGRSSRRTTSAGFSALKGGGLLVDDVRRLQGVFGRVTRNWSIETNYHSSLRRPSPG